MIYSYLEVDVQCVLLVIRTVWNKLNILYIVKEETVCKIKFR